MPIFTYKKFSKLAFKPKKKFGKKINSTKFVIKTNGNNASTNIIFITENNRPQFKLSFKIN